jgi:ubiquinone/menaquinone biosynthesis C-methylase UbiE
MNLLRPMPRRRRAEWMDEDAADERQIRQSLRFIQRVNHYLGYTRAIIGNLERFSHSWRGRPTIRIIDLATGSADIPRAILKWADQRGLNLRITAVDRHPLITRIATESRPGDPRLQIVRADVFDLPFESRSFDYALCAMFLHHLDEEQIVQLLRSMDRLARRGLIVADLLRRRRLYAWIKVLTLFSAPMVRHDSAASALQSLTRDEILALRDRAGIGYAQYQQHFAHRFILAGER